MRKISFILSVLVVFVLTFSVVTPVLAQGGDGTRIAPEDFTLYTPYPAMKIAVGENVTFNLTLKAGEKPQIVRLDLRDLPEGWEASFKGGGKIVEAAYLVPDEDTKISLRVDPPKDVEPGTYSFTVVARDEAGREVLLPIDLTIKDKLPPKLDMSVDLPTIKGSPDTTFRYSVKLKNDGDEDLTVNLLADAPAGMDVTFKLVGKEVTSFPLDANATKTVTVEAKPYLDLPAGTYPIKVMAQGGDVNAELNLVAEVTGQPKLNVTAPDGRLSGQAYVGDTTPLKVIIQNNGTAPARNIKLSASPPSGWEVEFDPKVITELSPDKQLEVTAKIKPADKAIAGDYVLTIKADPEEGATDSAEFRITVLTSTMWGLVGIGLIAVAVVVVGLAVIRFGRR